VWDFPRFLVLLRVIIDRLHAREPVERTEGELRKPADALHRDDESVATEQRDVPGDAGGRNEDASPDGKVRHPERFHIGDGLAPDDGERRVAGFDVDRWQLAGRHLRPPGVHRTTGKHSRPMPVDHGQPFDTRMPGLFGRERDYKLHPAVSELRV